jgi:hypothetical protein
MGDMGFVWAASKARSCPWALCNKHPASGSGTSATWPGTKRRIKMAKCILNVTAKTRRSKIRVGEVLSNKVAGRGLSQINN